MNIIEIIDRFGNKISLTRERWNHILKHEIPGLRALKQCLRDPEEVRKSRKDPDIRLYYKKLQEKHLCVVLHSKQDFIITAYKTYSKKPGDIVWKKI